MNKNIKLVWIVILLLIIGFSVLCYFNTSRGNSIEKTISCNQLFETKQEKYFAGTIGNSKTIYSAKLDTCLALNIYNSSQDQRYYIIVIDMTTDKTLLYFNGNDLAIIDKQSGMSMDEALQAVQDFGFTI